MKKAYLGIDIGSISTKGVIIDKENHILASEYLLTEGNPIQAVKRLISSLKKQINLQPVAKLKSRILFIKKIEKDTSISYGRTFISKDKMTIATIGIGYADGIRRNLSNIGKVIIDGKKSNMVGTICMDSFMADVTNIDNVKVGDYVYIWDNDKIKLEDIANQCNTISYEILSTISNRVPRVFVD